MVYYYKITAVVVMSRAIRWFCLGYFSLTGEPLEEKVRKRKCNVSAHGKFSFYIQHRLLSLEKNLLLVPCSSRIPWYWSRCLWLGKPLPRWRTCMAGKEASAPRTTRTSHQAGWYPHTWQPESPGTKGPREGARGKPQFGDSLQSHLLSHRPRSLP